MKLGRIRKHQAVLRQGLHREPTPEEDETSLGYYISLRGLVAEEPLGAVCVRPHSHTIVSGAAEGALMRTVRTAVTTTVSLFGIAAIALTLAGCSCAITTYIAGPTTMRPGQTATFTVMEQDDHSMETQIVPAGGIWAWNTQGPATGSSVNKGGGVLSWTAPSKPGKYTIFAVGGGNTAATDDNAGRGHREVRIVVTVDDIAAPEEQSPEKPAVAPTGPIVKILEVGNALAVKRGGSAPSFTIDKPAYVIYISTYHYLKGGGSTPGTLGLKGSDGKTYGPWPCKGVDGQGGVKNAFWVATPTPTPGDPLPAGTYTIVDSNPGTWSTNGRAKGVGFTTVNVVYAP